MNEACLPKGTFLGNLKIEEIYGYYDGPYLLSCRNDTGNRFLGLAVNRGGEFDTWLYAPVSAERLEFIRTGGLSLHDAFSLVEDSIVFQIDIPHLAGVATAEVLQVDAVPEEVLPDPSARLSLVAGHEEERTPVDQLSKRINRDVVDLQIKISGRTRPEAPSGLIARLLDEFQAFAESYGELLLRRLLKQGQKLLPNTLRQQTEFLVAGFAPGSLAVRLYAAQERSMFQDAAAKEIVGEFMKLIDRAAESGDDLAAGLQGVSGRPAIHFEGFLEAFTFDGELVVDWGQPDEIAVHKSRIKANVARDALHFVRERQLGEVHEFEIVCLAKAIHERLENFEVEDVASGERYHGKIEQEAMKVARHATINEKYLARIRETTEETPSGEILKQHILLTFQRAE